MAPVAVLPPLLPAAKAGQKGHCMATTKTTTEATHLHASAHCWALKGCCLFRILLCYPPEPLSRIPSKTLLFSAFLSYPHYLRYIIFLKSWYICHCSPIYGHFFQLSRKKGSLASNCFYAILRLRVSERHTKLPNRDWHNAFWDYRIVKRMLNMPKHRSDCPKIVPQAWNNRILDCFSLFSNCGSLQKEGTA